MSESERPAPAPKPAEKPRAESPDPALSVTAYAELVVELAEAGGENVDRGPLLAARGLDEASWDKLDDAWQDRLSRAGDACDDDSVPPLVAAYAEAFAAAERARAPRDAVPLEKFAMALRFIQRTGNPVKSVERAGITLTQFLQANQHWTARAVKDPDVAAKLRALLG